MELPSLGESITVGGAHNNIRSDLYHQHDKVEELFLKFNLKLSLHMKTLLFLLFQTLDPHPLVSV